MLQLEPAARRTGRLIAALAGLAALAFLAACGSVTGGAGRASTERSPAALRQAAARVRAGREPV